MSKQKQVEKVLLYITREIADQAEVLVFEHQDFPEAGIQVPAGTVEEWEDIELAASREALEEVGLVLPSDGLSLGRFKWFREDRNEIHWRNVFRYQMSGPTKEEWLHVVTGAGEDQLLVFRCYWMPLRKAQHELAVDQGLYLEQIKCDQPDLRQ